MKARKTVAQQPVGGESECATIARQQLEPRDAVYVLDLVAKCWVFRPGQTVMLQCQDGSGGPVLLFQCHDKGARGQRAWTVMFLDEPMLGRLGVFAESKLHPFSADTKLSLVRFEAPSA